MTAHALRLVADNPTSGPIKLWGLELVGRGRETQTTFKVTSLDSLTHGQVLAHVCSLWRPRSMLLFVFCQALNERWGCLIVGVSCTERMLIP